VLAHELGHNFSVGHAPCGTTGVPSYPYAGGVIGVWGWNATTNTLVSPTATDVMGYCGNQWISDWNWGRVSNFRSAAGLVAQAAVTDGLLVWGRGGTAGYTVEPAFPVRSRPTAEPANATHEADVYDASGSLLASHGFTMDAIDHADPDRNEQFAMVIPISADLRERVARIVVRSVRSPRPLASIESSAPIALLRGQPGEVAPSPTSARLETVDGRQRRLSWNNGTWRMGMVRDRDTGEILAFVRRSGATFEAGNRRVELILSDGTRTQRTVF
jgi:hypothetical protein